MQDFIYSLLREREKEIGSGSVRLELILCVPTNWSSETSELFVQAYRAAGEKFCRGRTGHFVPRPEILKLAQQSLTALLHRKRMSESTRGRPMSFYGSSSALSTSGLRTVSSSR